MLITVRKQTDRNKNIDRFFLLMRRLRDSRKELNKYKYIGSFGAYLLIILKTLAIIVCWLTHKHLGPENDILRKSALESLQNKAIKRVTKVFLINLLIN